MPGGGEFDSSSLSVDFVSVLPLQQQDILSQSAVVLPTTKFMLHVFYHQQ